MRYVHGAMVLFFVVAAITGLMSSRSTPGVISGFAGMFTNLFRNTNGA